MKYSKRVNENHQCYGQIKDQSLLVNVECGKCLLQAPTLFTGIGLDELVDDYNNTKHSSVKMTPNEASKKENE